MSRQRAQFMPELSAGILLRCGFALLTAGIVKGMLGIGVPVVSVSLLSLVISVPMAVSLHPVPILLSNLYQSLFGGHFRSPPPLTLSLSPSGGEGTCSTTPSKCIAPSPRLRGEGRGEGGSTKPPPPHPVPLPLQGRGNLLSNAP